MDLYSIMGLLGGLALFLYGMQMMSTGLEAAAGNRMKQILERLTANRVVGVLVGAGITAVIQSSSATTVMVVGFVNSGMMTLRQAVWLIMGANIGTTITGQLIALNVEAIAPLLAFLGVVAIVFIKNVKVHNYGRILAGLGVLFIGMGMMGDAMVPLRSSEAFISLMTQFSNPLFGILAGMIFTAIIQSSSASVGILQTLAMSGLIGLPSAVYVLFGQNIGTCITAVLASIGTSRNAKRTTIIHLLFNVFGTTLFTVICMTLPLVDLVGGLTPDNPAAQIANMHTLFNIVTTLLLLPAGGLLVRIARRLLPDKEVEITDGHQLLYIKNKRLPAGSSIGTSAVAVDSIRNEVCRMTEMVKYNLDQGFNHLQMSDGHMENDIEEKEEYIDYLNKEISQFISEMIVHEKNEQDSQSISGYFKICGDLERIGDHAVNLAGYADALERYDTKLTQAARAEILEMKQVCGSSMELVLECQRFLSPELFSQVAAAEQHIDDMTEQFRKNQIKRMQRGECNSAASVLYSEILTDFERIGDHILNIGEALLQMVVF